MASSLTLNPSPGGTGKQQRANVYIAVAGEDKILGGVIDPHTGAIDLRTETHVPGGPEMLAIDPVKGVLIAGCHARHAPGDAHHGNGSLCSYRIDRGSGGLTSINAVQLEHAPTHISLDRKSRFILTAHYGSGKAAIHRLKENGDVGEATYWIDSGGGAHCIHTDPSNRHVFLPHIALSDKNRSAWAPRVGPQHLLPSGANTILQFKFDEDTGTLTPNAPFKLAGEEGAGPRHYCFHPTLNVVYFSNEQGCAVTAYRLDPAKGTLTPFQHLSTFAVKPENYANCSSLRITRSGRFLYVLNRRNDQSSVAGFAVDGVSGMLKPNGYFETEPQPRELDIAPDDQYLYVAGFASGKVAGYRIQKDGQLEPLESLPVGRRPMWVLCVEHDKNTV